MTNENMVFPVVSVEAIDGRQTQTVNLRDLHRFLAIGRDFSTWARERISRYGFIEDVDYVTSVFTKSGENPQSPVSGIGHTGGKAVVEYHVSLDMAKELAMVENNERGQRVRRYFIDCERRLKEAMTAAPAIDLNNPTQLRTLAVQLIEANEVKDAKIAELAPKAAAHDRQDAAMGSLTITDAAKNLKVGRDFLFRWLRSNGWTYQRGGKAPDIAYQDKINAGYLEHTSNVVPRADGSEKVVTQARVTGKGLNKLARVVPGASLFPVAAE
ncbi:phage antirepressor KilAC domain-containing protein [Nitrospirillum amazonense]|uniref:phage antirepressor KilAC domain-containing protein n=1 Tax=Nitrospirillum amazonense TaxID=28077 RepID=UPI002DD43049|nr:phage antirepressor KilAC domain-containing protein [Nitrospirillum amazonense]MEC4591608.1 phage antirepressor KilAC domain-containing protein [Nitrospirillum amazonense]